MTEAAARAAFGNPDIFARLEYETTLPHGIERAVCKTFFWKLVWQLMSSLTP